MPRDDRNPNHLRSEDVGIGPQLDSSFVFLLSKGGWLLVLFGLQSHTPQSFVNLLTENQRQGLEQLLS